MNTTVFKITNQTNLLIRTSQILVMKKKSVQKIVMQLHQDTEKSN